MLIESLVAELSHAPFDPEINFKVAKEYEALTQTASAVAFYHRTAEHGYDTHPEHVYTALLRISHCFNDQSDRVHTVSNCLLQAITYLPNRPEAYLLMSQFAERKQDWQECYTWAHLGLTVGTETSSLPAEVGYYGQFCFIFQKAVSAWWIGRKDESIKLFTELNSLEGLPIEYKNSIASNLKQINATV